MKSNVCPYLGLREDPATALDFPSPGNICHHANPAVPIKGSYQEKFCLSGEHAACPIFLAAHPIPAPAEMVASPPVTSSSRRWLALIGIPAVIATAAAFTLAWTVFGFRPGFSIPNTGATSVPTAALADVQGGLPVANVIQVASPVPSAEPTPNCPRPENWVPYTINPTDSLYRLSVIYGISVEQLQQANCLGNKAVVLPGQIILVPSQATSTPTSTTTPTLVPPTIMQIWQYANNASAPQQNDPATNTAVPPSAALSTAVPPANPPPPAAKPPKNPHSVSGQPKQSTGNNKPKNNNGNQGQKNNQGKGKNKGK